MFMYESAKALNARKSAESDVVSLSLSQDWIRSLFSVPALNFWV